jgi:hypothetical protein
MKYILYLLAVAALLGGALSAQSRPERLYQAILNEGYLHKKQEMGRQLGRLGTEEAKGLLLKLLEDSHYWNQLAASDGLFYYKDIDVQRRLVREMMDNHMVRDDIARGIQARMAAFADPLAAVYREETDSKKRLLVLETMADSRAGVAEIFLRGVVADSSSLDRKEAFRLLARTYPSNYDYFRGQVDDPELRLPALAFVIDHGTDRELPMFTGIIDRGGEEAEAVIAYQAVAKWGDAGLKERTYLGALSSGNEVLARGGMLSFRSSYGPGISGQLGRLARRARDQRTRMAAGGRLAELGGSEAVAFLVPLLDEEYTEQRSATFTAIASLMTAGIWSVLDGLSQSYNRKSFEAGRSAILAGLRRMARADAGTSYVGWLDWAVYHGHTVRGANIVQYLFSGYPQKRAEAAEAGARLLGFKDARAFSEKNNVPASELALAMARALIEAGYLRDEAD